MMTRLPRRWAINLLIFSVLLTPPALEAKPLHIGSIALQPADEIKRFWPFADYLAKQLQSEGIDQGKVVVVESISEMATALKERKIDLYIDSPFPAVAVSRFSGAKFLVRRWKKGQAEYRAVVFALKDSGINRLEDLKGKMIAFEEPFSTSTYFLPKLVMTQKGLKLTEKKGASDRVHPDEVGYVFVGNDPNTIFWVLKKRAAAGVANNQNYLQETKGYIDSLKVIHETFSLPRQIVCHRADLDPKLAAKIKEILIHMDRSEEGKKILWDFEKTTRFDELPDQALAPLLKAHRFIDAEFGIR